jgi:voltage-gated potassium channel
MPQHRPQQDENAQGWRRRLHEVIFEADTKTGRRFDVILLWAIILSVLAVMLESVPAIAAEHTLILHIFEWAFTVLFTLEYIARIISVKRPLRYMFSFFGLVDLLSILPAYLGLFITGTGSLTVIRILRFIRIFRVLKLMAFMREAIVLRNAVRASRKKVTVFLVGIGITVVILGTIMYIIEDAGSGFTSIPRSIYWAIVTITTVGYGDIAPHTALGQTLASVIMIMGYAIIAVPTGIVTAELTAAKQPSTNTQSCPSCSKDDHENNAKHCKHCGHKL